MYYYITCIAPSLKVSSTERGATYFAAVIVNLISLFFGKSTKKEPN